jgi:hydrogenase-4 component E
MSTFAFDVSHFLAGVVVLMSFAMLYQDRLPPLINAFLLQSLVLALSIAWQAEVQHAPHLLITAGIEFSFKAVVIPLVLYTLIRRLKIHRTVETVVGIGLTMMAGMALVGLAMALMMRATPGIEIMARQDLAFALSVILLGLLIMVTRRNAVGQVIGFMSIENGLVLAATGAKGMPFVVETFVAFSVLIALIVIGIFLFRIRERFDTVDVTILDQFRGEQP